MFKKSLIILLILSIFFIFIINLSCKNNPEPKVWNVTYPIQGRILVGETHPYGPYSNSIYVNIIVNWTPTNQILTITLYCKTTNTQDSRQFIGGYASASWNLNDDYTYKIWISNLNPNMKAITYNGTITLFFQ